MELYLNEDFNTLGNYDEEDNLTQTFENYLFNIGSHQEVFYKASAPYLIFTEYDKAETGDSKVNDILRVFVERADGYADRDPWFNESDPYVRMYYRAPGGNWIYVGRTAEVGGCPGDDCDAVFNHTFNIYIDRISLYDVGPEVWDDDGGWSSDELLGYKDFYDVPAQGLSLAWRYLDQDPSWRCWLKFSVTYIDNGIMDPSWNVYPSGNLPISSAYFDWDNPPDRSGINHSELHISSDMTFNSNDEKIFILSGSRSSYTMTCDDAPPDGHYYFAIRVQDNAGHWSNYVSPGNTFNWFCPTPTPTPTNTPVATPTPTLTPTPPPIPTFSLLGLFVVVFLISMVLFFSKVK